MHYTVKPYYNCSMKTTIDIPDALYGIVKGVAAARGISVRSLVVQSLERTVHNTEKRPWLSSFGIMAGESDAVYEVDATIKNDLSTVDPEEWT